MAKEFKEVESGTKHRPELKKAIAYCKETGACLVANKLDRLARSVRLFEKIKREGIDFEIVGLPKNPLVQQVLASVAEWEARAISERTKAALAIKKAQGIKLGYHRPEVRKGAKKYWKKKRAESAANPKAPRAKAPSKREIADKSILPHIRLMRSRGETFESIACMLNDNGFKGRNGGRWSNQQVWVVANRNGIK